MKRSRGLAWWEGLIALAAVGVLAAIFLFPPGRIVDYEKPGQTTCMNNQKQLVLSVKMYEIDSQETLPKADGWLSFIRVDPGILKCPNAPKVKPAYLYNAFLDGKKNDGKLGDATRILVTIEGANPARPSVWESEANTDYTRHDGKNVRSFLDGHVEINKPPKPQGSHPPKSK